MSADHEPTVIDHRFFPHIIAMVIESASPRGLLAFRGVSKEFKALCDMRLLGHANLADKLATTLEDAESTALNFSRWGQCVRILDILPARAKNGDELVGKPTNIRTVRILSYPTASHAWFYASSWARAMRYVFFVDKDGCSPREFFPSPIPTSRSRIVINVFSSAQYPPFDEDDLQGNPDLVILFRESVQDNPVGAGSMLSYCISWAFPYTRNITVVEMPRLLSPKSFGDDWLRFFEGDGDEGARALINAIKYVSWEEFCRTSPHWKLETDANYRLTPTEKMALLRGDENELKALGLYRMTIPPLAHSMTTIAHAAFPHILSEIVSSASGSALLALRATCRDLKVQCDARLAAVDAIVKETTDQVRTRWPGDEALDKASADNLRHLDILRTCGDLTAADWLRPDLTSRTSRPQLRTIRILPAPPTACQLRLPPCSRLVVFIDWFLSPTTLRVQPCTCRIVISILSSVNPYNVYIYGGRNAEYVVLFHDQSKSSEYTSTSAFRVLANALAQDADAHLFTLVGVSHAVQERILHSVLSDQDWEWVVRSNYFESRLELSRAIRFLTWQEYGEETPNPSIEADPAYRLSALERATLAGGNDAELDAMGL